MDNPTLVMLYSKYSPKCKQITDIILGNKIPDHIKTSFICIDNKEVRKRITNNSKIKITYIPCILSVYKNGTVEQYESDDAFNFVQSLVSLFVPPPQQPPIQQPSRKEKGNRSQSHSRMDSRMDERREQMNSRLREDGIHSRINHKMKQEDSDSDKEEDHEENNHVEDNEQYEFDEEKDISVDNVTPLESLEPDDIIDSMSSNNKSLPIKKPKKSIRLNQGNYMEEEGEEYEPPDHAIGSQKEVRRSSDRNVKTGVSDISSRARELEKQREESDKSFKKKGNGFPIETRKH